MKTILSAAAVVALAHALPAAAAGGQIDYFGASASTVTVGSVVDFSVGYSVSTNAWQNGGSNPVEPAPQEGYQTWDINWYSTESETLSAVWLNAGGNYFSEYPSPGPGGGHSGSWTFSMQFDTPGVYQVSASGGWDHWVEFYTSNESAWRDCWNNDPGGTDELVCSWWTYEYNDWGDYYSSGGSFADQMLTIEVLAVPEPHAGLLGLAGLGGLLAWRRRQRS
jgi:MYXO-CTERM domain-containing protein